MNEYILENTDKKNKLKVELIPHQYSSINSETDYFGICLNLKETCFDFKHSYYKSGYLELNESSFYDVYVDDELILKDATPQQILDLNSNVKVNKSMSVEALPVIEMVYELYNYNSGYDGKMFKKKMN